LGSTFDAWSEHFNYGNWLCAFEEAGLNPVSMLSGSAL